MNSFKSFWSWWLLISLVYLVFNVLGHPGHLVTVFGGSTGYQPVALDYVVGFIGLFVPYGINSLLFFLLPTTWISLVVFIFLGYKFDKWLSNKNYNFFKNFLCVIMALFVLTMLVDIIRFTPFESFKIFMTRHFPTSIK